MRTSELADRVGVKSPGLAEYRRADLADRIGDLQRMHDSLAHLVATCDLPAPTGAAHCSKPSTTVSTVTIRRRPNEA